MPEAGDKLWSFSYEGLVQYIHEQSAEFKKDFLKIGKSEITAVGREKFLQLIILAHDYLLFSNNEEVTKKLKFLCLPNTLIRWFISLEEIIEQFDIINKKGVEIDKLDVLITITTHLKLKFRNDLLLWDKQYYIRDGVYVNNATKSLKAIIKRKKDNGGKDPKTFKNEEDYLLNKEITKNIVTTNGGLTNDIIIDFSKGRTDRYLLQFMLENAFSYDTEKFVKTKFLAIVYNIFRIVMQDRNLEDYDKEVQVIAEKDNYITEKANTLIKIFYKYTPKTDR